MKKLPVILALLIALSGCAPTTPADIAATTLPVYDFTCRITAGSGLTVERLITEEVSCLHDYTLTVGQMKAIEGADVVVLSGAGLEEFLDEAVPAGLDGMEVRYSKFTPEQSNLALEIAQRYGILPSGGSDYHGWRKPGVALGVGKGNLSVDFSIFEALLQKKNNFT